ncbi:putative F-box protein At5g42430 [Hordeum vulgare subsp. vulgare]|uniref:F-box domain-containing protein n=1 Tax=Hordeum vulgare subsp. vulgare TaxID=112509 RepID=A0A8I6Z5P0_HORVV|nr:putative F-box protein At5g42430 [Hordeum vulgare subsp. vulgare]
MPPGGVEASKRGRTGKEQSHPPAIRRRDESRPAPPFPAMDSQKQRKKRKQRQPASEVVSIPEGPLVEILSRLPYRSLCRFKCVSKQWRQLCSDPEIIKRAPQTLAGFFHNHLVGHLCFDNLSGGRPLVDASLPFLRESYRKIKLEQCSTSLLLCKCWESESDDEFDFVVCNPMTEQWTVLPPIEWPGEEDEDDGDPECFELRYPFLVFDPAVPSRFVVFAPLIETDDVLAIYSWETGQWTPSSGWENEEFRAVVPECAVFMNGMMHFLHFFIVEPLIAVLDIEGELCRKIAAPDGFVGATPGYASVGCSHGLLHAWYMDPRYYELSVWVLKDYATEEWTLKHTVNVPELFEETKSDQDEEYSDQEEHGTHKYDVFAIHPEHNVIFLTNWREVNLSYDMDSGQVHPMCTSGDFLGGLPFIPCFADFGDLALR